MRAVFSVRLRHQLVLALMCLLPIAVAHGANKAPDAAVPLVVRAFDLAANQDQPVLCFTLSQTVARRPDMPLESFIGADAETKLSAVPRNNRLCVTGFTFGDSYTITLKSGLPGVSGVLAGDVQYRIQIPNRPPEFDFAAVGDGVLPRLGNDGLPIRSVNMQKIDIDLFRIDDADIAANQFHAPLTVADLQTFAPSRGEHVWHGTIEPKADANRDAVTFVPVQQAIGTPKPGIYVASAHRTGALTDPAEILPTQYFLVSDLGLAAYRGVDSLTAWVRSLSTANAAAGTDIALMGRNNRQLARSRADDNGFVRFDGDVLRGAGGETPAAIFAYGQSGDFAMLDLDAQQDSPPTSSEHVLLYPDRDIYAPGDTVSILALLRTFQGAAIPKVPLAMTVFRPDGAVFSTTSVTDQGGGYDIATAIPRTGSIGTWRVEARGIDKADVAGNATFTVAANQPDRLIAGVSADAGVLDPTQPTNFSVQAQYLDGGAAPDTPGELRVSVAAAAMPFPAFPAFSFGLVDENVQPIATEPVRFTTDPSGKVVLPVKFTAPPLATKPLEAKVTARLFDAGGRTAVHSVSIPVASQNLILGIHPAPGPVFADQTAHFEVIALSPDGARQEKAGAGWEILRQESAPSWDWNGTRFVFRPTVRNTHVTGGMIDIPANAPASLDTKLPPGRYQIEVFDPTGEAISSAHFMVGWAAAADTGKPDAVDIKPAKPFYHAGETAEFFVKPPYEADVALISADPRIRSTTVQHIPAAGAAMRLEMPQDVGVGMQLFATALAPADAATPNSARRAFSQLPLQADPTDRQLTPKLDLPSTITPGSTLQIPVSIVGANDEAVFVRLVATDGNGSEGDLQETDSPFAALIAANDRAMKASDNYGTIIVASGVSNGTLPKVAKHIVLQDIDSLGAHGGSVTISSGIVMLDKNGTGKVPLAIPDFTGKLKIVATAWSAGRAGQAAASLPVHFPLAVGLTLPQRLAPDDRANLTLALDNIDGPRGEYHILPQVKGGLALQADGDLAANLAEHEQRTLPLAILAKNEGSGEIALSVTGPNGMKFDRHFAVTVSQPLPRIVRHAQLTIKPGATVTADAALGAGLRPESTNIYLAAGIGDDFELKGLGEELRQKQLMAVDQIVGKGSIYLAPPNVLTNLGFQEDAKSQLTLSIQALAAFQSSDGGFSRWASGDSDPWLSASVADFLTRSRAAGAPVSDTMMDRALGYLARQVASISGTAEVQANPTTVAEVAYAAKVLAANERIDLLRLRYLSDRLQPAIHEPVAAGFIAGAFAILDDKASAAAGFARAMALPGDTGAIGSIASDLDSQAIVTALAIETGAVAQPLIASSLGKLLAVTGTHRQFTTSEATWLFRVVATQSASDGTAKMKIGDKEAAQSHALWTGVNSIQPIKNLGDKPLHVSLTVSGDPAPGEVKDQGFELQRTFFDMSGKPVDAASVHQNDMLVVVLNGRFAGQGEAHPMIVDPLPAGWAIEAAEIADPANRYPWLKDLSGTAHAQADDGKYVAVPKLIGERHEFKVAYVVRAAITGQFGLPGALIEDTMQPGQMARTAAGRTKVDPAP